MRVVIQKVTNASVSVNNELISSIGKGLCVLVGISRDDTPKDIEYIVRKILNIRVFENDDNKRWSLSVVDKNFEILCVSQVLRYNLDLGDTYFHALDYVLLSFVQLPEHFTSHQLGSIRKFTLYTVLKGNKLDFHQSMNADQSENFYNQFLNELRSKYKSDLIKDGKFGAFMSVNIQNEGPVTITLDSKTKGSDLSGDN